jgi:hypothetical protein
MSLTAKWPAALVLAAVALCQLASSAHGQIIPGIYPNFQATPLIDGNSSPLYKGLSGFLYGHPYDGSNTPNDGSTHFNDGMAAANVAKVPLFGCVNEICNSAIVVLGIGFSNWTKELCDRSSRNRFLELDERALRRSTNGLWPSLYPTR